MWSDSSGGDYSESNGSDSSDGSGWSVQIETEAGQLEAREE